MMSESRVDEKVNLLFKLEMKLHKNSLNSEPLKRLHGKHYPPGTCRFI